MREIFAGAAVVAAVSHANLIQAKYDADWLAALPNCNGVEGLGALVIDRSNRFAACHRSSIMPQASENCTLAQWNAMNEIMKMVDVDGKCDYYCELLAAVHEVLRTTWDCECIDLPVEELQKDPCDTWSSQMSGVMANMLVSNCRA